MDVYLNFPLTKEYIRYVHYLIGSGQSETMENQTWCLSNVVVKLLNNFVKDLFNDKEEAVKDIKDSFPDEFEYLSNMVRDAKINLNDALGDDLAVLDYVVTKVDIKDSILFLKVELIDEL